MHKAEINYAFKWIQLNGRSNKMDGCPHLHSFNKLDCVLGAFFPFIMDSNAECAAAAVIIVVISGGSRGVRGVQEHRSDF